MQALTVIRPFAEYKTGDQITDPKLIAELTSGHNHANVVRVNIAVEQKPA